MVGKTSKATWRPLKSVNINEVRLKHKSTTTKRRSNVRTWRKVGFRPRRDSLGLTHLLLGWTVFDQSQLVDLHQSDAGGVVFVFFAGFERCGFFDFEAVGEIAGGLFQGIGARWRTRRCPRPALIEPP